MINMMLPIIISTSFVLVWLVTACNSQNVDRCFADNTIRLEGGSTQLEGRIQICNSGVWGTVCDDFWEDVDAQVACGQLGYRRDGAEALSRAHFGAGTGIIHLDDVKCNGSETRLIDCQHTLNHNCGHNEDAGIRCLAYACVDGDIRLANGINAREGRVEVCSNTVWGTVCDDSWDNNDAAVVCGQLGFSRNNALAYSRAHFGQGADLILLDDVQCSGTESRLIDCNHDPSTADCSHFEDAGVQCLNLTCRRGDIRLSDGGLYNKGRVEVCLNEQWGTVCDDAWSVEDAQVVCRQLGLPTRNVIVLTSTKVAQGTGPIFLDNVECTGSEAQLIDCIYDSHTADCSHLEDAGVQCQALCQRGDVRIGEVGRVSPHEGRVEVCLNNEWGTVCDDLWESSDAGVACRQLGFSRFNAVAYGSARYGVGDGPIQLDDVGCIGTESSLLECYYRATHDCSHFEDAGIRCSNVSCNNGDIRLVGGEDMYEGRVEVCMNEEWRTVCDGGWSINDAQVACRQLNYSGQTATPFTDAHFGRGSGSILLSDLACSGSETSLIDCPHSGLGNTGSCTHADDAGVRCRPKSCNNWETRLVGGLTEYEGRVELCWNEQWGTVCDDFWDTNDASVVCTQLGYVPTTTVTGFGFAVFGAGTGSILLDDVECAGTETSLQQCGSDGIGNHNCGHHEDAGIRCSQCVESSTRLVGGGNGYEGRVEVCLGGGWGTVCDDGWSQEDAVVVCRQLGFPTENVEVRFGASFGRGEGLPIHMDNVACMSTESKLSDCSYLNTHNLRRCAADHSEDAGVVCHRPPPGVPHSLTTSSVTATSVTVSWSHPLITTNRSNVIQYFINCSTTAAYLDITYTTADNTTLSRSLTGLHPYTSYSCCVRGVGVSGSGEEACRSILTLETVPSGPPRNIQGHATSSVSLSLTWDPPLTEDTNGRIREYHIRITALDTGHTTTYIVTDPRLGISSLHPYYRYVCSVAAMTTGLGPYSSPVIIVTYQDVPSGPPRSLTAGSSFATTIDLSWRLPLAQHRNGIITGYLIRATVASNGFQQQYTTPSQRNFTITSLSIYTRYTVTVAASTVNGTGPSSVGYEIVTMEAPPSRSPQQVGGVSRSPSTLELTWNPPPTKHHNGVIRGYKVNITEVETGVFLHLDTSVDSLVIPSLHPFYHYWCTVAAYTVSVGPYSTTLRIQMPTDVPSGPPTNIQHTQTSIPTHSVTLTWDPPIPEHQNGIITSYVVTIQNVGTGIISHSSTSLERFVLSNLTPDSEYTVVVAAQTNVGSGPSSDVISVHIGIGIPTAPPRQFRHLDPALSTSLTFAWIPPETVYHNGDIIGYNLSLTEVESGRVISYNVTMGTAYTARNLHPYYNYECRVAAYTVAGTGPFSSSIPIRTSEDVPSGSPTFLNVITTSPREVHLTWSQLRPNETNGIIIGYVLKVTRVQTYSGDTYTYQLDTVSTEYSVTTLPYATYMFLVTAYTSIGMGPLSMEIIVETPEAAPSDHPQNITSEVLGPTSFRLSWQPPPPEYHHGEIQVYVVNVTEERTGRMFHLISETAEIVVMDLHPYYLYSCRVAAVTVDVGPHSAATTVRTAEDAPSSPPTHVQATAVDSNTISMTWGAPPIEDQNGIIRKYEVQVFPSSEIDPIYRFVTTASIVLPDVLPSASYRCRVAAYTTPSLRGPFSEEVIVTTSEDVPSGPPLNVRATKHNPTTLTITWAPPEEIRRNGEIVRYQVHLFDVLSSSRLVREVSGDSFSAEWTDLHPFYTYKYSVAAATSVGIGPHSHNGTVLMDEAAPSDAPLNVVVDVHSPTSASVTWDPPLPVNHNGLIRLYHIFVEYVNDGGLMRNFTTVGDVRVYILDFLHPGTQYRLKVAAETIEIGPSSEYELFTTTDDVPGTPTNFEVVILNSTSAFLSWLPPQQDQQNGVIVRYSINVTLITSHTTHIQPMVFETTGLSYTINSLHPSWTYLFGVAAETSAGLSPFSVRAGILFEDAPTRPPQNLIGTSPTPSTLSLSWSPPPTDEQNGVIRSYKITVVNQETGSSLTYSTTGTSYFLGELHPHYSYNYSVAAHTVETGPPSSIIVQQPEDIPAGSPTNISVHHTSPTNAIIEWSSVSAHLQNGLISGYTVQSMPLEGQDEQETVISSDQLTYQFQRLRPDTQYSFSVAAMTAVGRGPFIAITSRTPQGPWVLIASPNVGVIMRISATQIQLSWERPSREDVQGTVTSYRIRYRVVESRVTRNLDDKSTIVEVFGTEAIIDGLEPHLTYAVSVAGQTARGIGNYSEEAIVGLFDNSPFQIHLYGAIVCLPWIGAGVAEKVNDIVKEVSLNTGNMCACDFSPKYIGQGRVMCGDQSTDRVIFRGTFISTDTKASGDIRDQLQEWVYTEPTVIVQGVQLKVFPCSVIIEESGEVICIPSSTTVTTVTVDVDAEETSGVSLPVIGGIAGGLVLLICGAFLLILIVVVMRKRQTKRDYRVERHRNNLNSHYTITPAEATNGASNITSFADEKELEDSKINCKEDEHIYEDPSNFEFLSPPQAATVPTPSVPVTSEPPPSYNTTVRSFNETSFSKTQTIPYAIANVTPKANGVARDKAQHSDLDALEKPALQSSNVGSSDVVANEAKVDENTYSQLDVATMPTLHYKNVGSSAIIPNEYEYLPSASPDPPQIHTTQSDYAEPSPPPQLPPNTSEDTPPCQDPSNYQPLLPPARGKKQTLYQPLGPPVGYAVPRARSNAPQTSTPQPDSDVPQPSLGGWKGPVKRPRDSEDQRGEYENVDGNQREDEYIEMSSPTL